MVDLPPLVIDIEDRMAWAAYTSHCAMSGIEEQMVPDYQQFKVERMVWDAVARGVVDAAAQFINEIKEKAARYDQMAGITHIIEPEDRASHPIWQMRCDHCGRERLEATKSASVYCNPPFQVRPHEWNGLHPSHRVTMQQILDAEAAYFSAKNDMQASTAHGRAKTEEKLRIWNALKAKYAKQDAGKT